MPAIADVSDVETPVDAVDTTDALKLKAEEIQAKISTLTESNIRTRWAIGAEIAAIKDDVTGQYGVEPEKALRDLMPLSKDALRPMEEFARTYTEPEVDKLVAFQNPRTKERLTWTHVVALTRVKDKTKAFDLAEWAVTNSKSTKDLNEEIVARNGGPKSKGGRNPKKPSTVDATLVDVAQKVLTFENAADKVWLAPGGLQDLFDKLLAAQGWRPNTAFLNSLEDTKARLDNLAIKAMGVANLVAAVKARAEARANQRSVA